MDHTGRGTQVAYLWLLHAHAEKLLHDGLDDDPTLLRFLKVGGAAKLLQW